LDALHSNEYIMKVDRGWDGRIFWLIWALDQYKKFRGRPKIKISYWNDRKNKVRKFYVQDLKNPVKEYSEVSLNG
jgi:hypothetical protein